MKKYAALKNGKAIAISLKEAVQVVAGNTPGKGSKPTEKDIKKWDEEKLKSRGVYIAKGGQRVAKDAFQEYGSDLYTYDVEDDAVYVTNTVIDVDFDYAKDIAKSLATKKFVEKSNLGYITADGKTIGTTNDTVQELREAEIEVADGSTLSVVTKSKHKLDLNTTVVGGILTIIRNYRRDCMEKERFFYDEIDKAASIADLRKIDFEAGWPDNDDTTE